METIDTNKKEIKINIPEGYEIDESASTFGCIKFKPKSLTYNDIEIDLFYGKDKEYITGTVKTKKQQHKLLAINKLVNVATYLNKEWKPKWGDSSEKYYICIDGYNQITITWVIVEKSMNVYFKSKEFAQQAIDILGEDTIRLALSTDW